jgi:hypothetical protein
MITKYMLFISAQFVEHHAEVIQFIELKQASVFWRARLFDNGKAG